MMTLHIPFMASMSLLYTFHAIFVYYLVQLSNVCMQKEHFVHSDRHQVAITTCIFCIHMFLLFDYFLFSGLQLILILHYGN